MKLKIQVIEKKNILKEISKEQEFYEKSEENALQLLMKKTENFNEEEFQKLTYEEQIQFMVKLLNEKTF